MKEGVVGDGYFGEGVDDPVSGGGGGGSEFEGVSFKEGQQVWDGEHCVVEIEAAAERADLIGDGLVRL